MMLVSYIKSKILPVLPLHFLDIEGGQQGDFPVRPPGRMAPPAPPKPEFYLFSQETVPGLRANVILRIFREK
jgi:hypothetical protein